MKTVRLRIGLLVGDVNEPAGALLELEDRRADELMRHGAAEPAPGPAEPAPGPAEPAAPAAPPRPARKGRDTAKGD